MGGFLLADLRRHWAGALAIALILAFATALGVTVTLQERALRLGSARAAAAFDLVVGAPGSETQLILSAVFLQPAPLPLVPVSVLDGLRADPRVAFAAPVGFGDFIDGLPIVGTSADLVAGLGGPAEGRSFEHLGDALAGSAVPLALGSVFHPVHGQLERSGEVHMGARYRIVGRMKPTGTPWDRAILVPIEAVWAVHEHEPADHGDDEAGFDPDLPLEGIARPEDAGLPAILVKPHSVADAYTLRQQYRGDGTLAVFPGEVLTRLYGTLGDIRRVLTLVALGAQGLVVAAILLLVVAQVLQRRRQIGALRAFGAPRVAVFALVWFEVAIVMGAGLVTGFGLGWVGARLVSASLAAQNGVPLPVGFQVGDGLTLLSLLLACSLAALVPAALAYRQSPAEALRS